MNKVARSASRDETRPILTGILVSAGGGDNMMGAIGTGNTRAGLVTASFGTSGTIYACSEEPVVDAQGEIAAFCDSTNRWLPLLCTMNVTVATEITLIPGRSAAICAALRVRSPWMMSRRWSVARAWEASSRLWRRANSSGVSSMGRR